MLIAKGITFIKANSLLKFNENHDLYSVAWRRAVVDSVKWIENYASNALIMETKYHVHDYVINKLAHQKGIFLEFGVFEGESINRFSSALPDIKFIGFDSFEGLQEDWSGSPMAKGHFSIGGILPKVNNNVSLNKGWINKTLPNFLNNNSMDDLLCVNIDVDTYETTVEIFEIIRPYLPKRKIYFLFDELVAYPNWQNGEFKALQESTHKFNLNYEFIAFGKHTALVEIDFT